MPRFDLDTLRQRAEEGIARHGLRGYARKLGVDMGLLRSLRDGRDVQTTKLQRIVDGMGLELRLEGLRKTAGAPGFGETEMTDAGPEALRSGYLPIPFHPSQRAYGASAPVAFARSWLEDHGLSPESLSCVMAADDDLAPSIPRGAICLIESTARPSDRQAIFARLENGVLVLSYLSRPKPGVIVISGSDPKRPPELRSGPDLDNLVILGRVVWWGQSATLP